eukprot:m.151236 g.151236  ORF g.151236 m.151236 type:complete len:76 (+) comp38580_c0_seq10:25-252(+)
MDRVGGKLCPEEFFARFLLRNKPCVIGSEITETWKARKRWVKDGKPNLQYLIDNFGNKVQFKSSNRESSGLNLTY